MSSLSRILGFYDEALKYANEALDYPTDSLNKSHALNSLGLVHKRLRNKEAALSYLQKCLKLRQEYAPAWSPYTMNNIVDLYNNFYLFDSALYWSEKGLHFVDSLEHKFTYERLKIVLLTNQVSTNKNLGNIEDAKKSMEKAHRLALSLPGYASARRFIIDMALYLGMMDMAKTEIDAALKLKFEGAKVIELDVQQGLYYEKRDQLDSALYFYKQAIGRFSNDSVLSDISIPVTESLLLQNAALQKMQVLMKIYEKSKEINYLKEAEADHEYLVKEIAVDRYEHLDLASAASFFDQKKKYLDILIEVSFQLYAHSKDDKYLNNVGQIMEVKRLNSFKKDFAFEKSRIVGIPDSLLIERRNLQAQINELRSKSGSMEQLTQLQKQLESIHLFIKKENKNFAKTISSDTKDLKIIENKLSGNESMIQFSFSEEKLYILISANDGSRLFSVPWEDAQEETLAAVIASLRNGDTDINELSGDLLEALQWADLNIKPGKVRILTDKGLAQVPFSILRQNDHYLLDSYNFMYMNSLMEFEGASKHKDPKLLSFAPFTTNTNISELRGSSLVDNLGELPGSTKELDNISKLWPGLTFKGQDATEAAFRKHAPSAGIIHLATHSLVDHNNPMNSVIVFSENNQNEEDGLLHTYELLNMKLNASLVTLSACNTGVGKYYEGEGMISLATGFNMAGVDNIVMSLWPVPDQTTSVIMTSFYSYLQKGKEVSEALRQAKLDFISSQDENLKHPYYWAGFVVSSDKWNTGEADRSWIWLLLIVFPVAVVLTIWMKIK